MINNISIRRPIAEDGSRLFNLIAQCPPLDTNSRYCNLLQCCHFSDTSAAAERDGHLVGFASGYLIPKHPDTLFIWQVAVSESARGEGLASRMIDQILRRSQCQSVRWIETTVTPDNKASKALFQSLADKLGTRLHQSLMFDRQRHFQGSHESEMLFRLGPFRPDTESNSDNQNQ